MCEGVAAKFASSVGCVEDPAAAAAPAPPAPRCPVSRRCPVHFSSFSRSFSSMFSSSVLLCVFVSRPTETVTFLGKTTSLPKLVVDFPLRKDTFRNTWKSSRFFACENKTLEIFGDFPFVFLALFFMFLHFLHFFIHSSSFSSFFHILSFLLTFHLCAQYQKHYANDAEELERNGLFKKSKARVAKLNALNP